SDTTAELVRSDLPVGCELRDLGIANLRDIEEGRLFQLVVEGLRSEFPPLLVRQRAKAKPRPLRRRMDVQVSRGVLLEREAELAAIQAAVDASASGAGRFVAIEGRAGMGKTRLVAEARALAAAAGFEV